MPSYYPSKQELKAIAAESQKQNPLPIPATFLQFAPGKIAHTDGLSPKRIDGLIHNAYRYAKLDPKHYSGYPFQLESVSDLTNKLYRRFAKNPESIANWLPALTRGLAKTHAFKLPKTKIWRLPHELAQFIRIDYQNTTEASRALFNKMIFDAFDLEDGKTYFIKTGVFSSKFEFRNAKCSEPREMGEYFQVINNFAMTLGAGRTIDLCVREYIEDIENNPTIYDGMPLHTEYRCFVDFDTDQILGIVNYWHPIVMKRALANPHLPATDHDYETYVRHQDTLIRRYNEHLHDVVRGLNALIPEINLKGAWSLDLMLNGKDLYAIDMARMSESALAEYAHRPNSGRGFSVITGIE